MVIRVKLKIAHFITKKARKDMTNIIELYEECPYCHQSKRKGAACPCAGPCPDVKELPPGTFVPCAQSGFISTPRNTEEKPSS
ncbi:MAG: hypothetical protein ABIH38_02180 [Patescibacteria group bacterium]